jgi:hypothetical protein
MFVGGDARAASNTPNGHLLMSEAAAGSGVSVDSSFQATHGAIALQPHNLLVSYRTYVCFMLGTSVGPHQKRMIFKRFSYVFKS